MTPWTVACQVPLYVEFPRKEYWSGLPFPSPGDLPSAGIEPGSPALQADTLPSEPPGKPPIMLYMVVNITENPESIQVLPLMKFVILRKLAYLSIPQFSNL